MKVDLHQTEYDRIRTDFLEKNFNPLERLVQATVMAGSKALVLNDTMVDAYVNKAAEVYTDLTGNEFTEKMSSEMKRVMWSHYKGSNKELGEG